MGDKHKAQKKDMAHAGHNRQDEMKKGKNKSVQQSGKHQTKDMPGADGFLSARADEDTYD